MAKPPRLCACGAIVPADQLCACQLDRQRERKALHDRRRPSAAQRGYDSEWRKLRAEFIRLHPFCAFCGAQAEHVDHKERHRGNRALLLSWTNLQSLCGHCHNSVKQRLERAAG